MDHMVAETQSYETRQTTPERPSAGVGRSVHNLTRVLCALTKCTLA